MGFHIDTHDIPAFRDFADASQHENTVTPIQGSGVNAGKKPLTSSRRATHMTIRRERNIMSPLGNQVHGDNVSAIPHGLRDLL
jgi:hypothetical protein